MEGKTVYLNRFGRRLGTREEGARVREILWQALESLSPGEKLVVDLAGLEVLSGSFADEAIASLLHQLRDGALPDRYLLIRADDGELVEDLSQRLAQRGLAALSLLRNELRVIGRLPPYLAEALDQVMRHGEITSPELAQVLSISVKNASVRLKGLSRLRLIRCVQESRPVGGIQYRAFSLVSSKITS